MSCQLTPDTSGVVDFRTFTGAQVKIFAESDSGTVRIVAATFNDAPAPVSGGIATVTAVAGINLLNLAFAGADPTEEFRIREDCGASSQRLALWRLEATPIAAGGPTRAFQIHAA